MGNKRKYKQFQLVNKDDYIVYLRHLIYGVHGSLRLYKIYFNELEEIMSNLYSEDIEKVPFKDYEDIRLKLNGLSHVMLMYLADEQKVSCSYKRYRRMLEKNNICSEIEPLSDNIQGELQELLEVRNLSFHNPESMINASIEVLMKDIPKEERKNVQVDKNPELVIEYYEYYHIACLSSLVMAHDRRIQIYSMIFQQMKKDYSKLIGQSVRIITRQILEPCPLFDQRTIANQLSMKMQKGKFKDYKNILDAF